MNATMTPPLYILSSERSGSNLLRTRLSQAQRSLHGDSPAHFLKHLHFGSFRYGDLAVDENFRKLIQDAIDLTQLHFKPWVFQPDVDSVMGKYPAGLQRSAILVAHFLMTENARHHGCGSYICKDNWLYEFANQLTLFLENVKFVHLFRDPRDFVLSQMRRVGTHRSVYAYARLWQYEQIKCIAQQKLDPENVIPLSYESFIADEFSQVEKLLDFLGLQRQENISKDRQAVIPDWSNLDKPTMRNNSGKYHEGFGEREIKIIESVCWEEMKYLGYTCESESRPKVSRLHAAIDVLVGKMLGKPAANSGSNGVSDEVGKRIELRRKFITALRVNYRNADL
ncbi:MAG: hypothetical protein ACI9P7_000556 [Candidatus Azotimanducaceae bacterium]|jgi:hypothetical protein